MLTFLLFYVLASYWVGTLLFLAEHPLPHNQNETHLGILLLIFSPVTAPHATWTYFREWLEFIKNK